MTFPSWPVKDPDELLDYSVDWNVRLDGDTILSSLWVVPTGITGNNESNTTTLTTIWLSGGTVGSTYEILNRITTLSGRVMDQTVKIRIKTK